MNKLLLLVFLLGVVVVALVQADESRSAEDRRRIANDRSRLRSDERRLKKDKKRSRSDESDSRRSDGSDESRRRSDESGKRDRSDESRRRDRSDDTSSRSGEDRKRVKDDRRRSRSDESRRRDQSDESGRRDRSDDTRSRSGEDRKRVKDDRRRSRSDESRRSRSDESGERRDCRSGEKRDCEWRPWKVAIRCSVSCGRGQRLLVRRVKQHHCNGGKPCEGRGFKVESCNTHKVCLSKRLDEFCRDRGDGEFGLGHCTDVYARCRNGHGKVHDCRHGQRFSHREGHCVSIDNVDECREERNRCKDREDGKHKLGDCREEYLFCNGRKGHVRRCRRHHVFDPSSKGCAPKSLVSECRERDRGCRDHRGKVVEGKLAVNRHACHEWYKVCKDGHAVLAKCPEDKPKFNPYARHCQTRHRCERAVRRHRSDSDSNESRRRSRSNESRRRSRSNESRRRSRSNESRRRSRSNESRRRSRSNESRRRSRSRSNERHTA